MHVIWDKNIKYELRFQSINPNSDENLKWKIWSTYDLLGIVNKQLDLQNTEELRSMMMTGTYLGKMCIHFYGASALKM